MPFDRFESFEYAIKKKTMSKIPIVRLQVALDLFFRVINKGGLNCNQNLR